MKNAFVDIHILQDLPPSNINRDDQGTPKQAVYGGVPRLRVSSQAWKRATRIRFAQHMEAAELGVRTRRLDGLLRRDLMTADIAETLIDRAVPLLLAQLNIKAGRKAEELSYLLFFARPQLRSIVDVVRDRASEWEALSDTELKSELDTAIDVKTILGSGHSLDVALFGRMVADLTELNVDAAAQVAHALSTHAASTQFDYFTAVDDVQESDETGAGMIGLIEFNAATLYRYATIAVAQLLDNLGDTEPTVDAVGRFLEDFVLSMPSGHQNSFAAHSRPAVVAVVVRTDQPVSLVSAFEAPVQLGPHGIMAESQRRLAAQYTRECERWGDAPETVVACYADSGATGLEEAFGPSTRMLDLLDHVKSEVRRQIGGSDE